MMGRAPYYSIPPPPPGVYGPPGPGPVLPSYPRYGPPRVHYTSRPKKRKEPRSDVPRTLDVIGCGAETTLRGHIDLLINLPVHHKMHRELLSKFKSKPGNYEGRYNENTRSSASVVNYGNGYLAIHFEDDLSQPEMSEFLMKKNWRPLYSTFESKDGQNIVYEKWTNQLPSKK